MAAPLSTAAVVNAIIFATYGSSTRLWEKVFENDQHDEKKKAHGTVIGEGAVFIERGDHAFHHHLQEQEHSSSSRGGDGVNIQQQSYSHDVEQSKDNEIKAIESTMTSDDNHKKEVALWRGTTSETTTVKPQSQQQNTLKVFTCGCIAGTIQAFVICPMEHIKCRLQVQSSVPYKGPIDCCSSIVKNHGIFRGLYRGMGVTLWRETPAFGMYFSIYDTIKDQVENLLEEKDDDHPIPSHAHAWTASALAGGVSGAFTWAIIYPFDVIKTQIQTSPLDRHLQKSMVTVARDIVNEHGWRHMFRGLGVTVARAFPVNAIIFPVYEFILVQLGDGE